MSACGVGVVVVGGSVSRLLTNCPKVRRPCPARVDLLPVHVKRGCRIPGTACECFWEMSRGGGRTLGVSPLSVAPPARYTLGWYTQTKRSLCTQHRHIFFDVRVIFKMSLGSRTAASAFAALQYGASEASSCCRSWRMNAERVGRQCVTSHSASTVRTPIDSDEVEVKMVLLLWENQDPPKLSKLLFVDGTISKEMRKGKPRHTRNKVLAVQVELSDC